MQLLVLQLYLFSAAALLFSAEPMVGKMLLPAHGAGIYVWATCLMFFQGLVFFAYLYAYALARRLGYWHFLVLLIPLLYLPLDPGAAHLHGTPVTGLLWDLLVGVGPLLFALATASVVGQEWLVHSELPERVRPYRVYAVSNLGSLLALLSYPILVETFLGLHLQRELWALGYVVHAALGVMTAVLLRPGSGNSTIPAILGRDPGPGSETVDGGHSGHPIKAGSAQKRGLGSRCPSLQREDERAPWWVQGKALPGDGGWNPRTTAERQRGVARTTAERQRGVVRTLAIPQSRECPALRGSPLPAEPATGDRGLPESEWPAPSVRSGARRSKVPRNRWQERALWLLLAAAPSSFLVAVTNALATDFGSMPIIWSLPLAAYIGSFILVFARPEERPAHHPNIRSRNAAKQSERMAKRPRRIRDEISWYERWWPYLAILGFLFHSTWTRSGLWGAAAHLAALTAICLAGHQRLYQGRPVAWRHGEFYVLIALGGWLGSIFSALLAPLLFARMAEYPLSLGLLAIAMISSRGWSGKEARPLGRFGRTATALFAVGILLRLSMVPFELGDTRMVARVRNHYGVYRVLDLPPEAPREAGKRILVHGRTIHGAEAISGPYAGRPISYFHEQSPLGEILSRTRPPRRAAIIGLGAGVLAAYFGMGDEITYYEIDPHCVTIAETHFSYLANTRARYRVVTGDGRAGLAQDHQLGDGSLDLLVVDAFSGDAIPTHLLTVEAFRLYKRKLREQGLLLLHVSNRLHDLRRTVLAAGREVGLEGACKVKTRDLGPYEQPSAWCVLQGKGKRLNLTDLRHLGWRSPESDHLAAPWTDDFTNPLKTFRLGGVFSLDNSWSRNSHDGS